MKRRIALVLSGGGMFGAWQVGAWRALSEHLQPDLIVGASAGSLNGYAIAGGASPEDLRELWMRPELEQVEHLPEIIQDLMKRYTPNREYAVVLTELFRLRPKIFQGAAITWRHLAASCAIPGWLPQYQIEGRTYSDGGLLNPLPVWAAADLGATHVVALNALPEIPSAWVRHFVKGFRRIAGHHPPLPAGIELRTIRPARSLGCMRDAMRWRGENIDRWIDEGYRDATTFALE